MTLEQEEKIKQSLWKAFIAVGSGCLGVGALLLWFAILALSFNWSIIAGLAFCIFSAFVGVALHYYDES